VKLVKDKKAVALARNRLLIDLDLLTVRDKHHGTLLRNLSLLKFSDLWDSWQHYKRTGIITMNANDAGRIIITFNNLAKSVGLDPDRKTSFTAAEKKEMVTDYTHRLEQWASNSYPMAGAVVEPLDPKLVAKLTKSLHGIFKKRGGESQAIKLDALAAFYLAQSDDPEEDMDEVKDNIRKLVKLTGDTWAIGAGAAQDIIRLSDEKGKATGAKAPPPRGSGNTSSTNSGKTFQRFMAGSFAAAGLNLTKQQFLAAKKELKAEVVTIAQLKAWLDKNVVKN
jgi:hypothetical protein